ncbi:MAG: ArsA family ATPase [Solirubrobacteraceae bacterium]|nr:ArsA family ATPase [Solirubrobacteraceae bacterium]
MAPRIVLYTGKGGVGKTSVAAATARRIAADGGRVLVASTDPAHSLADVLGRPVGSDVTRLDDRLDALQIDGAAELGRHWGAVRDWASRSLVARGVDGISALELTVPPGAEELLSLLRIAELREAGDHDVIVVDCAPTGETLRLLAFPDVARWWLDRVVPRQEQLLATARPLARAMLGVGLPDVDAVAEINAVMASLLRLRGLVTDHDAVTVRLVTTADRVVIDETRRTYTYLSLYGIATDAVVVNRLFPADVGAYFADWRARQAEHLDEIEAAFAPLPVLRAPYFAREILGDEPLDHLADALFDGLDPAARLHDGPSRELVVDGDVVTVRIALPLADRDDVALRRSGDDLVVEVDGRRRSIHLPATVAHYRATGARLQDGTLTVTLGAPTDDATVDATPTDAPAR